MKTSPKGVLYELLSARTCTHESMSYNYMGTRDACIGCLFKNFPWRLYSPPHTSSVIEDINLLQVLLILQFLLCLRSWIVECTDQIYNKRDCHKHNYQKFLFYCSCTPKCSNLCICIKQWSIAHWINSICSHICNGGCYTREMVPPILCDLYYKLYLKEIPTHLLLLFNETSYTISWLDLAYHMLALDDKHRETIH